MKISYSIDGGETVLEAPEGLRIYVDLHDGPPPHEDSASMLEFNFTAEGLVTDLWSSSDDPFLSTSSEEYDEIATGLSYVEG